LRDNIEALPLGRSTLVIPNHQFELRIGVEKTTLPHSDGRIFFGRYEPPLLAVYFTLPLEEASLLPTVVTMNRMSEVFIIE